MARDDLHFRLRIPEDLKKRVEEEAEKNQRSMTAEIIDRLNWSFDRAQRERDELANKLEAAAGEIIDLKSRLSETEGILERLRHASDLSREFHKENEARLKDICDNIQQANNTATFLLKNAEEIIKHQQTDVEILAAFVLSLDPKDTSNPEAAAETMRLAEHFRTRTRAKIYNFNQERSRSDLGE